MREGRAMGNGQWAMGNDFLKGFLKMFFFKRKNNLFHGVSAIKSFNFLYKRKIKNPLPIAYCPLPNKKRLS
jgi:hypothetical protein